MGDDAAFPEVEQYRDALEDSLEEAVFSNGAETWKVARMKAEFSVWVRLKHLHSSRVYQDKFPSATVVVRRRH